MKKLLFLCWCLIMTTSMAEALSRCPGCSYLVKTETVSCPKCLKLLRWPFVPERSRQGKVIVRTGSDAFIRHPQAQNRSWKAWQNAGADPNGEIGAWGGPTTLRYLLKFDISDAFALAGVDLATFKLRRATLKICGIPNHHNRDIPVVIYPLTRPFQEGSSRFRHRERNSDGCDWYFSAPLLTWHSEGGDFDRKNACRGVIKAGNQTSFIDITEIIRLSLQNLKKTGTLADPGLIIMADPEQDIPAGFATIHSLDSHTYNGAVRSPELFIE